MNGRTLVVTPDMGIPLAAAVIRTADPKRADVVVIAGHALALPPPGVVELLTGPYRIGAVMLAPAGTDAAGRRDVDSGTGPAVALQASTLARLLQMTSLDPAADNAGIVIGALLSAVRAEGLRVVRDTEWVTDNDVEQSAPASDGASRPALRILVITDDLGRGRQHDRAVRQLITSLDAQCIGTGLSILLTERPSSSALVDDWRQRGIDVSIGPPDPAASRGPHWGTCSHVVLTAGGARSMAREWVDACQPQAAKILFLPALEGLEVESLRAVMAVDERDGLDWTRDSVDRAMLDIGGWADSIWCLYERDAARIAALVTGCRVALIPPAVAPGPAPLPGHERKGIVIVATEGHDVLAASEDAAVRALQEVVPRLQERDPGWPCTVVSDWPTPMLEMAAAAVGARIVGSTELSRALGSARLLLAAHAHGTGQPDVILEGGRRRTPLVATSWAAGGLDVDESHGIVVAGTSIDLADRAWMLLTDDARWDAASKRLDQWATTNHHPARRARALRESLASLGVTTAEPSDRWPPEHVGIPARPHRKPAAVALRPGGAPVSSHERGGPEDETARYRMWAQRYGPTAEVLQDLGDALEHLVLRPRFSVLVAALDVDDESIHATVDSVRGQIYPGWELCLAVPAPGSEMAPPRLDGLRSVPGIKIVPIRAEPIDLAVATNAALGESTGQYVTFLEPTAALKPHALAQVARWIDADPDLDVIYSDEDQIDRLGRLRAPDLKPDWSPDLLMSRHYMGAPVAVRRSLLEDVGGMRAGHGDPRYDLVLRLAEQTDRIGHIPEPLRSRRDATGMPDSGDGRPIGDGDPARRALQDALVRRGLAGDVERSPGASHYRVRYPIPGQPRVAIIIPTRDRSDLLSRCIESVAARTTYRNYEIVIVDNGSTDPATLGYLAKGPWRVIRYPYVFHYGRMTNLAARLVRCDALLFLNNDTEVISAGWIEAMLEHAMRPEVGAVGGRLRFADGRPQHEGIIVGTWPDWATNIDHRGYRSLGETVHNTSAVTGACTMIRPSVYWHVGGSDERLRIAFSDVDMCLRIRQAGYQIVYTPHAELYHHEGSSRQGHQHHDDGPLFGVRWHPRDAVDPYYSPLLSGERPFEIAV
jgi:GT2 family glycosyltransferase